MGNFRNGELATGLGRQSSVFQMLRRRSACLLLSITTVARRDRPTGDRAPGRHKVFAACRRGSDSGNLRPPKSACAVDPDEKLEAIEAIGPPALRKRPFDLRTADCRPKGRSVMESQISKIYAPSNAAGRQLPITEFAHKATVIGDLRVQAVLAAHDMAAESHRAAALDRRHYLQLAETDVTCIGLPPSRSMVAEDIRDLQGGTSHDRRGLCRRLLLRCQRREPIQRAHDRADHVGGYLRVERGGIEPGMSEQNLDQTHIGFLFEQVGGKAVAQCVRRHSLLDRRPIGSGISGSRPGNSQTAGRAIRYQSRSNSNSRGESIAKRSLRPLPCSMRSSMRSESMSDTFSATTSETRNPAP